VAEYPRAQVRAVIDDALRTFRTRSRRRTRREAAAERLVQAVAVLIAEGIEPGDVVAFEDARAAVEKYRAEEE
jgi:hypothetical protein